MKREPSLSTLLVRGLLIPGAVAIGIVTLFTWAVLPFVAVVQP